MPGAQIQQDQIDAGLGCEGEDHLPVAIAAASPHRGPSEVGTGATEAGRADKQRRRQLDQGRLSLEQLLALQHELAMAHGDAAA